MHIPVDHRLRGFYRGLASLIGLLQLMWGVVAWVNTSNLQAFNQSKTLVWGVSANPASAAATVVFGAIVLVAAAVGRNIDVRVNYTAAVLLMLNGTVQMLVMNSSANYLSFSMTNCVINYVFGMGLLAAGLYGTVSTRRHVGTHTASKAASQPERVSA